MIVQTFESNIQDHQVLMEENEGWMLILIIVRWTSTDKHTKHVVVHSQNNIPLLKK